MSKEMQEYYKRQNQILIEKERRRLARQTWWSKNGSNFFWWPIGALLIAIVFSAISVAMFHIGANAYSNKDWKNVLPAEVYANDTVIYTTEYVTNTVLVTNVVSNLPKTTPWAWIITNIMIPRHSIEWNEN